MKLSEAEKRQRRIDRIHQHFRTIGIGKIFNQYKVGVASLFQRLVRLRARDEHGYCTCFTCGDRKPWGEMDSGHFISRSNKATILDPFNCHPQCVRCNQHLGGNASAYLQAMVRKYGIEIVEDLQAAKLPRNHTWDKEKLAKMKVDILDEIARLEKENG